MRLAVRREPFDDPEYLYELKYDGFRAIARVDAGRAELISRRSNVYKSFAQLCGDVAASVGRKAVLDGEIVYLDAEGRPQFYELPRPYAALLRRLRSSRPRRTRLTESAVDRT